ncbi:MAG: glycosyltransferase 87 family protein [Acidobacteriota bacterium]
MGAGFLLLAGLPAWRAEPLPFVAAYLLLFAGYSAVLFRWLGIRGARAARIIFISGAVFRVLVLLLHPPDLSQDVARYAWDGYLATQHINPYAHPPADPALIPYRTDFFGDISYKNIPTIYPPTAQLLFLLAALLHPGTFAVRMLLVACDLGVMLGILRLLQRAGLPEGRLLVYAWCPLPVVEIASSGHLEPLGTLCLIAIPLALAADRRGAAGAALSGAVLAKVLPLALAPLVLRRGGRRAGVGALLAAGVLVGPFLAAGPRLLTGLGEYATRWRYNDFLFAWLVALFQRLDPSGLLEQMRDRLGPAAGAFFLKFASPGGAARLVAAGLAGLAVLWVAFRPQPAARGSAGFMQDAGLILAVCLLLSPTFHPWYLLWLLPVLCFVPSPPWILLSGSLVASYLYFPPAGGVSAGPSVAAWIEFAPAILLGIVLAFRKGGGVLPGPLR